MINKVFGSSIKDTFKSFDFFIKIKMELYVASQKTMVT